MGYGDGIRRLPKWKRVIASLTRRGVVEVGILGLAALSVGLRALGDHLSR